MCRACRETPDNQGRRCPRDDGFSVTEGDQRNRARGLNSAAEALARGEVQAAVNQLENARRAQRTLDGVPAAPAAAPTPVAGPYRDIEISPSSVDSAKAQLDQLNRARTGNGQQPLDVEITRQATPDPTDPIMSLESVTVRVSGATDEELGQLRLSSVTEGAERRVQTGAVLAAACAITRVESNFQYVSRKAGGEESTPARVAQYVNDDPDGPLRQRYAPTPTDESKAQGVMKWARETNPTNDYIRAMRHSLSEKNLSHRDVGTAASAVAGYNRAAEELAERNSKKQEELLAQHAGAGVGSSGGVAVADPGHYPRGAGSSRWLNQPGDKIMVTGTVERVTPIFHESHWYPRHLYIVRTPDGDVVKWLPSNFTGFNEGDNVTLRGQVKAHITFNGEKQTEMNYCTPELHQ